MHPWALVFAICLAFAVAANGQKKVVCYYASWATYRQSKGKYSIENIDPTLCSHIIYSFIGLNNDGSIRIMDPWLDVTNKGFEKFTDLKKRSPSLKTIVAIGGWAEGSSRFSPLVSDPNKRAKFVNDAVAFLKKYRFDGLDVDWEFPNQRPGSKASDKENFVHLLRELKQRFSREGLSLSAAVNPTQNSAQLSYKIREISQHLDFINLMTYDYHGTWDGKKVGHNAPLYASPQESGNERSLNVDASVKYWISQGAPPSKIIVGTAFYGRSYTLADPNNHKRGSPATGAGAPGPYTASGGTLAYYEVCEKIKSEGWRVEGDAQQHVPYAFKGNQIVGYDDFNSLREKAEYVKRNNLGGAMVWSMDTDDFNGVCGEKNPLLQTLNRVLRR